jgi:activator of HSP90 ATPase
MRRNVVTAFCNVFLCSLFLVQIVACLFSDHGVVYNKRERRPKEMAKVGENDPRWIVADRQDGKNVNAWHWEEKDLTKAAHEAIKEAFKSRILIDTDEMSLRTKEVSEISGDVTVAQRKGKIMCYFEIKMTVKWGGKVDGESVDGKMVVPEVEHDNFTDDFDVNVSVTDNNAASNKADSWVRANGRKVVREEIRKYFEVLFEQYQVGKLAKNAAAASPSGPATPASATTTTPKPQSPKPTPSASTTSSKSINWTMQWRVPIDELFAVLMNEQRAAVYTRAPAKINPQAGGQFEFLGGVISGYYVDVQAPTKITMQWRLSSWASGVFSSVIISLSKEEPSVTRLEFAQAGIPDGETDRVMQGWRVNFFDAIKMVFGFGMEYL